MTEMLFFDCFTADKDPVFSVGSPDATTKSLSCVVVIFLCPGLLLFLPVLLDAWQADNSKAVVCHMHINIYL